MRIGVIMMQVKQIKTAMENSTYCYAGSFRDVRMQNQRLIHSFLPCRCTFNWSANNANRYGTVQVQMMSRTSSLAPLLSLLASHLTLLTNCFLLFSPYRPSPSRRFIPVSQLPHSCDSFLG